MKQRKNYILWGLLFSVAQPILAISSPKEELKYEYDWHCNNSSDIFEHIPTLRDLAAQCFSVTEIGLRDMNSTWGILQGLTENSKSTKKYTGIDLDQPPEKIFSKVRRLARENDIEFRFIQANDMDIDIDFTDLLFIDSLHTYCHLTYELEKFSGKALKYIAMHDTDAPWRFIDDFQQYFGDRSEYPAFIDSQKRGLWQAVVDFLEKHPEWVLLERRVNNHGFTILKRVRS